MNERLRTETAPPRKTTTRYQDTLRHGDGTCSYGLLLTDDQRTEATLERNCESRRLSTLQNAVGDKVRFKQDFT